MDPTQIPCRLRPAPEPIRRAHFEKYRGDTEQHLHQGDLPSYVDFRERGFLPPVLDQGQLGSCVFNASMLHTSHAALCVVCNTLMIPSNFA